MGASQSASLSLPRTSWSPMKLGVTRSVSLEFPNGATRHLNSVRVSDTSPRQVPLRAELLTDGKLNLITLAPQVGIDGDGIESKLASLGITKDGINLDVLMQAPESGPPEWLESGRIGGVKEDWQDIATVILDILVDFDVKDEVLEFDASVEGMERRVNLTYEWLLALRAAHEAINEANILAQIGYVLYPVPTSQEADLLSVFREGVIAKMFTDKDGDDACVFRGTTVMSGSTYLRYDLAPPKDERMILTIKYELQKAKAAIAKNGFEEALRQLESSESVCNYERAILHIANGNKAEALRLLDHDGIKKRSGGNFVSPLQLKLYAILLEDAGRTEDLAACCAQLDLLTLD